MRIELDLNSNDAEALLRHAQSFNPESGDAREDRRLSDALRALAEQVSTALSESTNRS